MPVVRTRPKIGSALARSQVSGTRSAAANNPPRRTGRCKERARPTARIGPAKRRVAATASAVNPSATAGTDDPTRSQSRDATTRHAGRSTNAGPATQGEARSTTSTAAPSAAARLSATVGRRRAGRRSQMPAATQPVPARVTTEPGRPWSPTVNRRAAAAATARSALVSAAAGDRFDPTGPADPVGPGDAIGPSGGSGPGSGCTIGSGTMIGPAAGPGGGGITDRPTEVGRLGGGPQVGMGGRTSLGAAFGARSSNSSSTLCSSLRRSVLPGRRLWPGRPLRRRSGRPPVVVATAGRPRPGSASMAGWSPAGPEAG